jgi:hypothetical protein
MVENFDLWIESREQETVEEPADPSPKKTVSVRKYKTVAELIGVVETEEEAAFALSEDDEIIAEQMAAGLIDLDLLLGGGIPEFLEEDPA